MVAAAIRRKTAFSGLRPLDNTRDLGGVAAVIAEAFRGEMDPAGARAVREMRLIGRLGPLAWWLDLFAPVGEGFTPGFVWLEDGHIVGNATLRRAFPSWRGWIIGNVAVLPEYRGHSIARRLIEACVARARDEGGEWVALEVRADNAAAYHLYSSLGFRQTGARTQQRREANAPMQIDAPADVPVRGPRSREGKAIFALAQSVTPEGLRWAEPLRESEFALGWDKSLDVWLAGQKESWRIVQSDEKIVGAIEAQMFLNPRDEGRLRLWVAPGRRLHAVLLSAMMGQHAVALRPMTIAHPADDADAWEAIAQFGFQPLRTLAHMKLDLR
jgi:GNAT superfamily N-acetyltransferase